MTESNTVAPGEGPSGRFNREGVSAAGQGPEGEARALEGMRGDHVGASGVRTTAGKVNSSLGVGYRSADPAWPEYKLDQDRDMDEGIKRHVRVLRAAGIETFESCQGGVGHPFPVPTVRFFGDRSEGFRAFAAAMQNDLRPAHLRRVWSIEDGDLTGPRWEMTFTEPRR